MSLMAQSDISWNLRSSTGLSPSSNRLGSGRSNRKTALTAISRENEREARYAEPMFAALTCGAAGIRVVLIAVLWYLI